MKAHNFLLPLLIVSFFVILCKDSCARQNKNLSASGVIDSLRTLLLKDKEDTSKVNHLNSLCWGYLGNGSYDTAMQYGNAALLLARQLNFKRGIASAYNSTGTAYLRQGIPDSALKNYFSSLKIREEIRDKKGIAVAHLNIGFIYVEQGKYNHALDFFLSSLKIQEEIGDKKGTADSYSNIGFIYYQQGSYDLALEKNLSSLKKREEIGDKKGIADAYSNIGVIYQAQGNNDMALEKYLASFKIREEIGDKKGIADSYNNIGFIYYQQGNYDSALDNYIFSLKIKREVGDKRGIARAYNNIGNLYLKQNKIAEAKEQSLVGLSIAKEIGSIENCSDAFQILSKCDSAAGNWKGSYEYHKLYSAIKDSIFNEESSKQIAEMSAKYETEKKEKEIILLNQQKKNLAQQNEIKQLAINKSRTQIAGLSAGIALLIVVGFLLYQWNRSRQKAILNAQMISQQEIRLKAIVQAQEEERKRIATDLHDGVGQLLTGTKMALQNFSDEISQSNPNLLEKLTASVKSLYDASNEVRSISHQMMPRALSRMGLIPAIEDMLGMTLSQSNITYEFEHSNISERLDSHIEICLYRITQELVNNILKHAQADKINIQMFKSNNQLALVVTDNGKGFNFEEKQNTGMGLMNITTRIKSINGNVKFQSGGDGGTTAIVTIPLAPSTA